MVQPNIVVFEERTFASGEIDQFNPLKLAQVAGVAIGEFESDINLFERAKSAGSLLKPKMSVSQIDAVITYLNEDAARVGDSGLLDIGARSVLLSALQQLRYLADKYHCVIANPPYLGSGGMDPDFSGWIKENYPDYKSDSKKQGALAIDASTAPDRNVSAGHRPIEGRNEPRCGQGRSDRHSALRRASRRAFTSAQS